MGNKNDNPLKSSDGMGEAAVRPEPETSFDERTTGIVHPWQIGTDADPTPEADDHDLVGVQTLGDGKTEDQMVATPAGTIDQPEGHENPMSVNPDPAGVGVETEGVELADLEKGPALHKLDPKEETKRAKVAQKAEDEGTVASKKSA